MNKSLDQVEAYRDRRQRFLLLETLRDYTWEQLVAHGETADIQQHHAQAYLQLAQT